MDATVYESKCASLWACTFFVWKAFSLRTAQKKTRNLSCGSFLVGAGGFASRALKMPHWGIFAPRDVTAGPGLFESTSAIPAKLRNTKSAIPLSKYRVFVSTLQKGCPSYQREVIQIYFHQLACLLDLSEAALISSLTASPSMSDEMSAIFKCFHKDKNMIHWLKVFV